MSPAPQSQPEDTIKEVLFGGRVIRRINPNIEKAFIAFSSYHVVPEGDYFRVYYRDTPIGKPLGEKKLAQLISIWLHSAEEVLVTKVVSDRLEEAWKEQELDIQIEEEKRKEERKKGTK